MSQFVKKLEAKTSGVIKGVRMVEVVRANYGGRFEVQVACLPEVPDGIEGYYPGWFKQYIIDNLRLTDRHLSDYYSNSSMTEYVILQEVGKGFLKYGFYRRIFTNSDGDLRYYSGSALDIYGPRRANFFFEINCMFFF